jgi:competence protein ComEC
VSGRQPILFIAAFGAGLATGLLHFWVPLGVAALLLGGAAAMRRTPLLALCLASAAVGVVHGSVAVSAGAKACAARLPPGELRLLVVLEEPADSFGGVVQLRPHEAGCTGTVRGRWPAGVPRAAGAALRVTARWVPRQEWSGRAGGTLVVWEVLESGRPHRIGLSGHLRNGIAGASRELYGARAPLVDALIVGRRADMHRDLKDAFAQSGLVHLLSISGFHVGLLAAWIVLVARGAGVRRERALIGAAVVAAVYVGFLGWPAPAARAAALAGVLAVCRVRQRHVQADPLLAATCLAVMLVDPWAVFDLGGWLSAAALWGATACTRWSDRTLGTQVGWRCLVSSVGATLATAPLTALALGTVALIGIVLNFAAIPLAAAAVPGVAASLLFWPIAPGLATALAAGSGFLLHLLELLALAGAAVPGGHIITEAGPTAAWPWVLALAALVWGMHGRSTRKVAMHRWACAAAIGLWVPLAAALAPAPHSDGRLALHFLDVGQGDAAVIRTPAGRFVVVDAGPRTDRTDAGRRVVTPFLTRQRAGRLAALVISHAHADHLGGATAVLDRFPADVVLEPGALFDDPEYARFLGEIAAAGLAWRPGRPGDTFIVDGVQFSLLHPDTAWSGWGEDLNEDSLVLLVEYGGFRALFSGDAGLPAEQYLAGRIGRVSVLKVGHHGSRGATGDNWLAELQPQVAVVSVGTNKYGHPAPETLARLARAHPDLRRTDRDGTVSVVTDGAAMTVSSRGREVRYELRER